MTKVKTVEFWLIAIPALMVAAVIVAGFDQVAGAAGPIPYLAVTWLILAVYWIGRELFRRIAS
jgi:hypothetical protein